jgi:hypothetical protein
VRHSIGNSASNGLMIGLAAGVWLVLASAASSQSPSGGSGARRGGDEYRGPSSYYHGAKPTGPTAFLTVHGGKYLVTRCHEYELVIMPLQMRLYGFDESLAPIDVKDVRAELTVQLPAENRLSHIIFQHVLAGMDGQDYLVAAFDTKQLRDRDTSMTMELSNLPDPKQPKATFSPLFTPAKIRPYVAQVLLRKADAPAVVRQRVCPVCGEALGSHGRVVKVLIGEYPLFLCSEDCLPAVQQDPRKFLPPPPPTP